MNSNMTPDKIRLIYGNMLQDLQDFYLINFNWSDLKYFYLYVIPFVA